MDFLRQAVSLTQQALSKGSTVPGLPNFGLGERKSEFDGLTIWTLYQGHKRDDDTNVSIFVFDVAVASSSRTDKRTLLQLAKNALRKLRALRHPDVLKFIDGTESDTAVYIVTEPVVSLSTRIGREGDIKPGSTTATESGTGEEWRVWGLSKIVSALGFINESGTSTHGNLRLSSVFVTPGGEWRLGGFEVLSSPKDASPIIYTHSGFLADANKYAPPECLKSGYDALKSFDVHALDSFQLYLFLHVLFNGPLPFMASPSDIPSQRGQIPPAIFPHARRLYSPNGNPNSRLKASTFHALGFQASPPGFFRSNRLVNLADSLDSFALASEHDRAALISRITEGLENAKGSSKISDEFAKWKVLPAVTKALEFGPGGPLLLPLILSIGETAKLTPKEYDKWIAQPVLKAYASPDRAMRLALLEALPSYVEKLEPKQVSDKIWPNLLTGFGDAVPVIREATVKSVLLIAPKLTDRILNNDLLRHLAKTQMDVEPGIRTNTCILLGRLSKFLNPNTNSKVLIPAFSRSLRDAFVHARIAGLMALMATMDCYSKEDLAGRVIPAMSFALIDKEKLVRDQAFKALEIFVQKLEGIAASMPETAIPPGSAQANGVPYSSSSMTAAPFASGLTIPAIPTSAAGAAGALAGWAMTSFAKKLVPSDLQTGIGGTDHQANRPSSTPPAANGLTGSAHSLAPPSLVRSSSAASQPSASTWAAPPEEADLMNVAEDDWDPLEAFSEPLEDAVELEEPEPDFFPPTLSMATPRNPPAPKSTGLKLAAGAAKSNMSDALLQEINDAGWGEVPRTTNAAPAQSHQKATDAGGWNDPPPTLVEPTAAPVSRPLSRVKNKPARVVAPFLTGETDGWADFDDADKATDASWNEADSWNAAPPAKGDAKSKVAQMREERKARLAAMKAQPPPQPTGAPNAAKTAPPPPKSKFTSGVNTQYRF